MVDVAAAEEGVGVVLDPDPGQAISGNLALLVDALEQVYKLNYQISKRIYNFKFRTSFTDCPWILCIKASEHHLLCPQLNSS